MGKIFPKINAQNIYSFQLLHCFHQLFWTNQMVFHSRVPLKICKFSKVPPIKDEVCTAGQLSAYCPGSHCWIREAIQKKKQAGIDYFIILTYFLVKKQGSIGLYSTEGKEAKNKEGIQQKNIFHSHEKLSFLTKMSIFCSPPSPVGKVPCRQCQ